MRIIFLCGSLEPGRDGVGDYTRRLAGELIRQGHEAAIIALHDKHLQCELKESTQTDELQEIDTLRLSKQLPWKKRIKQAAQFIERANPEWISLQYVAFSFHKKGMPVGLSGLLAQLTEGRKLHIMFHELWVGVEAGTPRKTIWWGYIQRSLVKELLIRLKPASIHTQSQLYQYMLSNLGYKASLVPLFGNIPVKSEKKTHPNLTKNTPLTFVIFGGIHENALIDEFASELSSYSQSKKIALKFIFLGNNGKLLPKWASVLTGNGFDVDIMGEQPVEKISEIFSNSSFGLTSTPLQLTDKSGSVAAMAEHGMNIICIRDEWKIRYKFYKSANSDNSVVQYSVGNIEHILSKQKSKSDNIHSVDKITSYIVNHLQHCN